MPKQIYESLVGTVNSPLLHREIFDMVIEKYVEDIYVWKWGDSVASRQPGICKDKEGNKVLGRRSSGLLRCRGHGREMAGLSLRSGFGHHL